MISCNLGDDVMSIYWANTKEFDKYVAAFGNRFAATRYVAQLARYRRNSVNCCISEAQALSWVVSGVEPAEINVYYQRRQEYINRKKSYINDRILYIEEKDIHDAVQESMQESTKAHHLIYKYNDIKDKYKKSRVRIICNMIWDELSQVDLVDATRLI